MLDQIAESTSLSLKVWASIDESRRVCVQLLHLRQEARDALMVGREVLGEARRTAAAVSRCTTAGSSVCM